MLKILSALLAVGAVTAVALSATPAQAEVWYPWCATYGGRGNGVTACGWTSYAQCRATISGIGGHCFENPAPRPAGQTRKRGRRG